jgi:hypothetical protein
MSGIMEFTIGLLVFVSLALGFLGYQNTWQRALLLRIHRMDSYTDILGQECSALGAGMVGMGHRILEHDRSAHYLQRRVEENDHRDKPLECYDRAQQLLKTDLGGEEIQRLCGLNDQEMDVLMLLGRG